MRFPRRHALVCVWVSLLSISRLSADSPEIVTLRRDDSGYEALVGEIAESYKLAARGEAVDVRLYRYSPRSGDTLFTIASRVGLPPETVATTNRIDSFTALPSQVLLPSSPGLAYADDPVTLLEELIYTRLRETPQAVSLAEAGVSFVAHERLASRERLAFLGVLLRPPLASPQVTSPFGMRRNPFSDDPDDLQFHHGIDLVADDRAVVAVLGGEVLEVGFDTVLGTFVRIAHDERTQTRYAHLERVDIAAGEDVSSGQQIGEYGTTGLTTGPHLHFEVLRDGIRRNPTAYLPRLPSEHD